LELFSSEFADCFQELGDQLGPDFDIFVFGRKTETMGTMGKNMQFGCTSFFPDGIGESQGVLHLDTVVSGVPHDSRRGIFFHVQLQRKLIQLFLGGGLGSGKILTASGVTETVGINVDHGIAGEKSIRPLGESIGAVSESGVYIVKENTCRSSQMAAC
jgi:hypothetical protein